MVLTCQAINENLIHDVVCDRHRRGERRPRGQRGGIQEPLPASLYRKSRSLFGVLFTGALVLFSK